MPAHAVTRTLGHARHKAKTQVQKQFYVYVVGTLFNDYPNWTPFLHRVNLDGEIKRTTNFEYVAAGGDFGQLQQPKTYNGHLFLADPTAGCIRCFNLRTRALVTNYAIDAPYYSRFDIYKNKLYVPDTANHRILVYRLSDGDEVLSFGSEGSGNGQFRYVADVRVYKNKIYVPSNSTWIEGEPPLEQDDNRVQVFSLNGVFENKWTVFNDTYLPAFGGHFNTGPDTMEIYEDIIYAWDSSVARMRRFSLTGAEYGEWNLLFSPVSSGTNGIAIFRNKYGQPRLAITGNYFLAGDKTYFFDLDGIEREHWDIDNADSIGV